jgi:predicted metalloprotease
VTKIRSRSSSRIQDRRGSGGGGVGGLGFPGLGGGGGGLGIPTKAGGGILGIIVVLAALFLPKLLGGGSQGLTGANDPGLAGDAATGEVQCTTEIEQILCGAVEDVSVYWVAEYPKLWGASYREADTVFFSGGTNTGCGQASSQMGPFYCPADELVYFDLDFLQQMQQQFGAVGDLAAQYIVAHEYGHHVQNVLGVSSDVSRLQQQNPGMANQYSVALELQADCFAGAWARSADERGLLEQGEISEALDAAAAVGDDRIQSQAGMRVDPESFTHGTSEQRVSWFRRGYDTADPKQCTTFDEL